MIGGMGSASTDVRRRRSGVLAGVLLLVLVGGLLAILQPSSKEAGLRATADLGGAPLAGGVLMSSGEAEKALGIPLPRPDVDNANERSIKAVWVRTDFSPQALIEYESGIVLTVRPQSEGQGTDEYAEAQLKDGVPGKVVDLGEVPAFEVPQGEFDLGSVRFLIGTEIVTVIGNGDFAPRDLRMVAASIVQSASPARSAQA